MDSLRSEENILDWGETTMRPTEKHEFVFAFNVQQDKFQLKIPLNIPIKGTVREVMFRIIATHNVPCYIHNGKTFSS